MARLDTTLRVLKVMHYLETSRVGMTIPEIHQKLVDNKVDVHERTVRRDIETLQQALLPVEADSSGRYKLKPFAEIKKGVQFTYQEIFALYVARNSLKHFSGSPIYDALENLFTKLEKLLGTNTEAFDELLGTVAFRPQQTWHTSVDAATLDTVHCALAEGHPLKIFYKAEGGDNPGEIKERTVGPECLYFANANVYLIAKDLSKNEPRTYALSRVAEAEMITSQEYEKEGLNPELLFKDAFGLLNSGEVHDIEVLINGPVGTYVAERRFHESQQTQKTDQGVLLKMNVRVNDELARWILGLGAGANVKSPELLQKLVEDKALEIAAQYSKKAA